MIPYEFAVAKAQEAGEMVLRLREKAFTVSTKENDPRNILTSVDLEVNTFLIDEIKKAFPTHTIYSEEGADAITTTEYVWTLDPIDGTSNFSRSIPHFSTCIGLLQNGTPVAGAVYNPVTKELFSFEKGKGAFLNGKPIHASAVTDLMQAEVFLHAGRSPELWSWGGETYTKLLSNVNKTANFGGSALDLCFVAAGRIEAVVYGRLTSMDIAGAIGIVTEAGGVVVGSDGAPITLTKTAQKIVAVNNTEVLTALSKLI